MSLESEQQTSSLVPLTAHNTWSYQLPIRNAAEKEDFLKNHIPERCFTTGQVWSRHWGALVYTPGPKALPYYWPFKPEYRIGAVAQDTWVDTPSGGPLTSPHTLSGLLMLFAKKKSRTRKSGNQEWGLKNVLEPNLPKEMQRSGNTHIPSTCNTRTTKFIF